MITLKEFLGFLCDDCRLHILDYDLVDEDFWDDKSDCIVYFGDYREVPVNLLSRQICCFMVSDEFVNCLHIELKRRE